MYLPQTIPLRRGRYRRRPELQLLEARTLLSTVPASFVDVSTTVVSVPVVDTATSADTLSFVQADPAAGSTVTQPPSTITVTFNLPIDPFSLSPADFGLDQVNADGSLTPLDPNDAAGLLSEVGVSASDPNSITLGVNQLLPPGQYELVLLGTSMIAGLDANGNDVFWAPPNGVGTDAPLSSFTIHAPGVTLADATDLGVVGATPVVTTGALDLATSPSAVSLYQVTLSPGHFWRFGAEIWTSRIGSALDPTLALFDANGQLIKTATVGAFNSPNDPYLFAGLQPGTYYVGISGTGNVPGRPGGYDPVSGTPGSSTRAIGGTFQLDLAAAPEDTPTTLQSFALQYADPRSDTPTGFTVAFSRPIDVQTLSSDGGNTIDGIQVVDRAGVVWPVTAVSAQGHGTQLTFVFNQELPPGHYTLRLPAQGGLADLAGIAPVAAHQSTGVLAHWTVRPDSIEPGPYDLGALYPQSLASGISLSAALEPGQSVTYRVVALPLSQNGGVYFLTLNDPANSVSIRVFGSHGTVPPYTTNASAGLSGATITLTSGVYYIRLTNAGNRPVVVSGTLSANVRAEDVITNGVGQGPAVNLLFVNSPAGASEDASSATATAALIPALVTSVTSVFTPTVTNAPAVLASPGGLVLTLGGSLVGTPPNAAGAAVGMTEGSTDVGLLTATNALPAQPGASISGNSVSGSSDATVAESASDDVVQAGGEELTPELTPVETDRDARVVADNEWLGRVGERLAYWFALAPASVPVPVPASVAEPPNTHQPSAERIALQRDDLPAAETERVDKADLSVPLGVGVVCLVAARLSHPVRRFMSMRRRTKVAQLSNPHRGPHRNF